MINQLLHARRSAANVLVLTLLESAIASASAQVVDMRHPSGPTLNINPLSTLDLATLEAFRGRPLFAPSRRPPLPPQVNVAPPVPTAVDALPPDLHLVGVIAGVEKAIAILRRPAGGSSFSLKLGDAVETWQVHTISPDSVTLRNGTREAIYRLFTVGASNSSGLRSNVTPPIGLQPGR